MFCFDAAGKLLHVGRWNTFVSVLPIDTSELEEELPEEPLDDPLEEPLDDPPDEPPDEDPPEVNPEPEPVLSVEPSGNVKTAPLVEKTTLPFLSVL